MSLVAVLAPSEIKTFSAPPVLNKAQRRTHFRLAAETRHAASKILATTNRAGFLLQLGYFHATGRFFPSETFRTRDIDYVMRRFKLADFDLTEYGERVARRHRALICELMHWRRVDNEEHAVLRVTAIRHVENQEHPRHIFSALIRQCWRRQWVIPSYSDLAEIITSSFNVVEARAISSLDGVLESDARNNLEDLLKPIERGAKVGSVAPLTLLKRIDQSLNAGAIKKSTETLKLFRDHYFNFSSVYDVLELTDKAIDYYATWLTKARNQQIRQFPDRNKAYLHVLCFIKNQFYRRQDHGVDVLLKSVTSAKAYVRRNLFERNEEEDKERIRAIEALRKAQLTASEFAQGVVAIIDEKAAGLEEKFYKIERLTQDYRPSVNLAGNPDRFDILDKAIERSRKNASYYELLETYSLKLQNRVSNVIRVLVFDGASSDSDILTAIDHFKAQDGRTGPNPPLSFLTEKERDIVVGDGGVRTSLYKSLLFLHVADRIKSGELNLVHSFRYRAIQDYLIPIIEWRRDRDRILKDTGLERYADGAKVLAELKDALAERFETVNKNLLNGTNKFAKPGEDGRIRVSTPRTDFHSHSYISSTLSEKGIVPILDVMKSIDRYCGFTKCFRHMSNKHAKIKPGPEVMMAGVMARGCNIGLGKLAKISTGINVDTLTYAVNWCFNQENVQAANKTVTETIRNLALANQYVDEPTMLHSSSDGHKVSVATDSIHAAYSYKYFGQEQGVTDYSFIDQRQAFFHGLVFTASDRDAPYVLDGLVDNSVPHSHVHSTDTHGFTEQIFGASYLMGITFAPRLAKAHRLALYGFSTRRTHEKLGYFLRSSGTINQKLILDNWDDILRFIATIKTHRSSASQLFKRLSSYAKAHPLYRAIKEFGRIIKTQFLLTYFDDASLRQKIQKQLNLAEQGQKFARAVFFDNDQSFQYGAIEQQQAAVDCRLLLQNCIILWNYLALSEQVANAASRRERKDIVAAIRSGSVVTWAHVNLRGEYAFTPPSANDPYFDVGKIQSLRI